MVYEKKGYYKDLAYLNRPESKVIFLESDSAILSDKSKNNAIIIPKFDGITQDKILLDLIPFLDHLSKYEIKDVRKEI